MDKTKFTTKGEDPDKWCTTRCPHILTEKVMIGSSTCKDCPNCYGWDEEESWVKCSKFENKKN